MGRPRPTPATRRTSATPQPRLGGLLSLLGDVLVGQDLAQPGMLVVHVLPLPPAQPACSSGHGRPWSSQASSEWRCGVSPESGTFHRPTSPASTSLGAGS